MFQERHPLIDACTNLIIIMCAWGFVSMDDQNKQFLTAIACVSFRIQKWSNSNLCDYFERFKDIDAAQLAIDIYFDQPLCLSVSQSLSMCVDCCLRGRGWSPWSVMELSLLTTSTWPRLRENETGSKWQKNKNMSENDIYQKILVTRYALNNLHP